jgi:hypothetical protein
MERSMSAKEAFGSTLHSCPELCTQLGLQGLACLATSSKNVRSIVIRTVCKDGLKLLDSALATAQHNNEQKQHKQAAAWLATVLLRAQPATTTDVTIRMLSLPAVPFSAAKQLVAAGMRVSYAQLLAAANNMVAGVEVWVQAQQQLGIANDIPALALDICCGHGWVSARSRDCRPRTPHADTLPLGLQECDCICIMHKQALRG